MDTEILDTKYEMNVPLTRIQKLIGQRMLLSKRTKPCFCFESKVDLTELMAIRRKLRKKFGIKITTNAFYIHTLGLAVREFPLMAGRLYGDNIRIADSINVGFAVNAPQGLVVPVIRNADEKTLPEIALLEQSLTDKARDNQLALEDIENETVALSNLGIYGIDSFIGIVPPPASTILAIGNILPTVVCNDDEIMVRRILTISLAVDHRIANEVYSARFLKYIKEKLQNPEQVV